MTTTLDTTEKKTASKVTFYGKKSTKADTTMVVNDILHLEDEFAGLYWSNSASAGLVVQPPYNPVTLQALTQRNNVLAQAVSAMEVNIDGTGFTIEPASPNLGKDTEESPERQTLLDFFTEPFPETSFIAIRRQLRYDLETTGNAYLEVLRTMQGEITFLRYLDSTTMRLCRLDAAVIAVKEVKRGGSIIKTSMFVRERRFVQKVGQELVYFKEFKASRELSRKDGGWLDNTNLDLTDRATEVIHLTCEKDVATPYGVPRWINQLPSIMGSRKAEEFNLEFFDAGGVPPAVVFVQGGSLTSDVTKQLNGFFHGGNKAKHRVAVVEVQSSSGSLDSSGSVQVKTERFGDSRSSDAMFQSYDKACEEHVRVAFRLAPLFIGKANDYSFATAQTSYMVTEAQVFQPERLEFDEVINIKIVRGLGITDWVFKSSPLTMKNIEAQLKAIEVVKGLVDDAELVETVNEISGLNLKYSKDKADQTLQTALTSVQSIAPDAALLKTDINPTEIVTLVSRWNVAVGVQKGNMSSDEKRLVLTKVAELSGATLELFNTILASNTFLEADSQLTSMASLACGCTKAMGLVEH